MDTVDNTSSSSKKNVDGIILVLSCQKHRNTRLKEFSLGKTNYEGWEVIYVIGDLFLKGNYLRDGNILYIRCEDSYMHLLKKLGLAIKSLKELFNIKEGILRCGDDLIFNEDNLTKFIKSKKFDYWGQSTLKNIRSDPFMMFYYNKHKEDFLNPQHGMTNMNLTSLSKYTLRPNIYGASGVIFYLSNKACDIVIQHMERINFNIFSYDTFTKSYPYTIEDCGISFIMYYNNIEFTDGQFFYDTPHENTIARHTNKYK
jgi:hypothetical protein